jgi:hypothetical protein
MATGEWHRSDEDRVNSEGAKRRWRLQLMLRGESLLTPDLAEYALHGVPLSSGTSVSVFELCRFLAVIHRDQVLASPRERRACIPDELGQILQLEEWRHPDLANSEPPSSTETFQQLADVLESGEPSRYSPSGESNTHWANWPDGGTL